ncbi:fumarylacetoacetate hydrolase family protein [Marivivens marinus]|uniref:fumarylacetoacetate hydrolase family protein n=1 Tax=Marivivens marinus TaxID=3110173 RepID=UPI003B847BB3
MKLLRVGPAGGEKPAMLDASGVARDLSAVIGDIAGDALSDAGLDRLRAIDPASLPALPADARIGACVAGIGKVIGIGLNYSDHAEEMGMDLPAEPITFMKATSSVCGPDDSVEIPRGSVATDWEVELGVVIGTRAKYVNEAEALSHVAGYCTLNDLSERDYQMKRSGQWVKGKSHDTFCPLGPWLVTRDEVADPQNLNLRLSVNGQVMQDGTTATMYFGVATIISHLSQFMTLEPGDVIATGTPPGVGSGKKPPVFLRAGDVIELEVEGLGRQRQTCVPA